MSTKKYQITTKRVLNSEVEKDQDIIDHEFFTCINYNQPEPSVFIHAIKEEHNWVYRKNDLIRRIRHNIEGTSLCFW